MRADDILYFWFVENGPDEWWKKSEAFDALVRRKFLRTYEAALAGELAHWRVSARGRLAEIIVLDQFPRNMFRGTARSFEADTVALVLSQEAVAAGTLAQLPDDMKPFLVMPYMHSESRHIHIEAMELFSQPGLEGNLSFEKAHKAIIDRFGRYPHRNDILHRVSTAEEIEFLKGPNSSF